MVTMNALPNIRPMAIFLLVVLLMISKLFLHES